MLFSPDAPEAAGAPATPTETATPAPQLTEAETRKLAVQAYYDAETREAKAAVVKQYPILATIFSAANHN